MTPRQSRPAIDSSLKISEETGGDHPRRLALRLDEVVESLGVSRRSVERERSAGRFPSPDLTIGRMPLWKPETIREWIERGGRA